MEKTFETPGPVRLRVELLVGDVRLRASETQTTAVRLVPHGRGGEELVERFTLEQRGDEIVVLAPKLRDSFVGWSGKGSVDVEVDLPERSEADLRLGSGDVSASGVLGRLLGATGSGDFSLDEFAGGDLKSGSGDIAARVVRGPLTAKTGSGDVAIDAAAAPVDLVSGSGDISVRRAEGALKVKTGSGDVVVGASVGAVDILTGTGDIDLQGLHGGEVRAKTGTGDVVLGVVTGVAAFLDLNTVTGDVRVDLDGTGGPEGAEATTSLSVTSGSGDIRVKRAQVSLS